MTQASHATLAHAAAPAGRALVDILLSRQSHFQLAEPAPRDEEIELIFDAAMRAPDHAQLRPWRFALIRDEARAELAEVLVELAAAREPQLTRDELESRGDTARSTPLIIAVAAAIREDGGIPEVEQLLSTGAATMNMLNTIHALATARSGSPATTATIPNCPPRSISSPAIACSASCWSARRCRRMRRRRVPRAPITCASGWVVRRSESEADPAG